MDHRELPSGTVTFLFSDVEGSSRLVRELGDRVWAETLAAHRRVIEERCRANGGCLVDREGDGTFLAFATATEALHAAAEIQEELARGPVRVRVGVHTGTPVLTGDGYVGLDVHRAARIAAAAHGGQVVFSSSTRSLADERELLSAVRDLGEHRLKDLAAPERLFQLGEGEFPPLRSLPVTNLPVPATPFLGRRRELLELTALIEAQDARLLTLTGPGGAGKTRLALQVAAEVSDAYPGGVWWVPLAPVRDVELVLPAVAQTLGLGEEQDTPLIETLGGWLAGRRLLLLLDNAEHLLPKLATELSAVVAASPSVRLLVTSRERLQLAAELVFPVPPLSAPDGERLFVERARALGVSLGEDEPVSELCRRLDGLPLALELAAARTVVFAPTQLLERLGQRLDLLKGNRDADPRQLTLRATIDWSYELLSPGEQELLSGLAVFNNGCTYEAAEAITFADADTMQSLLDKSLLRRRDGEGGARYWMLTTIHEYALEKLALRQDQSDLFRRHAAWYRDRAAEVLGIAGPGAARAASTSQVELFGDDYDNAYAALKWAWTANETELALEIGTACCRYWLGSGFFHDARDWLEAALPKMEAAPPAIRLHALKAAGLISHFVLADSRRADELWAQAAVIAGDLQLPDEAAWLEHRRAGAAFDRGDIQTSIRIQERLLSFHRENGNMLGTADVLHTLGESWRDTGNFEEAQRQLEAAQSLYHQLGDEVGLANNSHSLADLALDRGHYEDAVTLYRTTLTDLSGEAGRHQAYCLAGIASALAGIGEDAAAAVAWGAVCNAERTLGFRMLSYERRRYERHLSRLEGTDSWEQGQALTLEQAAETLATTNAAAAPPTNTRHRS
jgi:predicted ATPase/class 3 adenylate cyclase